MIGLNLQKSFELSVEVSTRILKYKLKVSERGDITTVTQPDGVDYKVNGQLTSYQKENLTIMVLCLLDLKLDVLGKLFDER